MPSPAAHFVGPEQTSHGSERLRFRYARPFCSQIQCLPHSQATTSATQQTRKEVHPVRKCEMLWAAFRKICVHLTPFKRCLTRRAHDLVTLWCKSSLTILDRFGSEEPIFKVHRAKAPIVFAVVFLESTCAPSYLSAHLDWFGVGISCCIRKGLGMPFDVRTRKALEGSI